jgi:hypothetical protein
VPWITLCHRHLLLARFCCTVLGKGRLSARFKQLCEVPRRDPAIVAVMHVGRTGEIHALER